MCLFTWGNDDNEGLFTKILISTTFDVYPATKTFKGIIFVCLR